MSNSRSSWLPSWLGRASNAGSIQEAQGGSSDARGAMPATPLPSEDTTTTTSAATASPAAGPAPAAMYVLEVEPASTSPAAAASSSAAAAAGATHPSGANGSSSSNSPADGAEDFSDLDALGFLLTDVVDKAGRPVVVVVARRVSVRTLNVDRLSRYFIHKCSALARQGSYSLVWMHTLATYRDNCPGLSWLWRTYERLPSEFRSNLSKLFVLHCDMSLWVGMSALAPWFSSAFWRKVEWVSRVEFLYDHIDKRRLPVPEFVAEHDEELEEHPLRDYGLLAMKLPGIPATQQP